MAELIKPVIYILLTIIYIGKNSIPNLPGNGEKHSVELLGILRTDLPPFCSVIDSKFQNCFGVGVIAIK